MTDMLFDWIIPAVMALCGAGWVWLLYAECQWTRKHREQSERVDKLASEVECVCRLQRDKGGR